MKKVIACIIVCCILLCLFAACGKKETYKNIYISKDICPTKDELRPPTISIVGGLNCQLYNAETGKLIS